MQNLPANYRFNILIAQGSGYILVRIRGDETIDEKNISLLENAILELFALTNFSKAVWQCVPSTVYGPIFSASHSNVSSAYSSLSEIYLVFSDISNIFRNFRMQPSQNKRARTLLIEEILRYSGTSIRNSDSL